MGVAPCTRMGSQHPRASLSQPLDRERRERFLTLVRGTTCTPLLSREQFSEAVGSLFLFLFEGTRQDSLPGEGAPGISQLLF